MKNILSVLLTCLVITSTASAASNRLSFEQRVAYQNAIEEVYWKHTIWPDENPQPKPARSAIITDKEIRQKVLNYLQASNVLQQPITGSELQAEMDRMARRTKDPEILQELFAALNNDPYVMAECLARPLLLERRVTDPVEFRNAMFDPADINEDLRWALHALEQTTKPSTTSVAPGLCAWGDGNNSEPFDRIVRVKCGEEFSNLQLLPASLGFIFVAVRAGDARIRRVFHLNQFYLFPNFTVAVFEQSPVSTTQT
jgi:hypothetical protein